MSHYKMRRMSIKKNGEVTVNIADSSLAPLKWWTITYGIPGKVRLSLRKLCVSMLNGNIHPYCNCTRARSAMNAMQRYKEELQYTSWETDFRYALKRDRYLDMLLAEFVGVPMILGQKTINSEKIKDILKRFDEKSKLIYEKTKEQFKKNRQVLIQSASQSNIFPGYTVLSEYETGELILAKGQNYGKNRSGLLENKDNSAIYLGNIPGWIAWEMLSYGISENSYRNMREEINEATKRIPWSKLCHLQMGKMPYPEFDAKSHGFTVNTDMSA